MNAAIEAGWIFDLLLIHSVFPLNPDRYRNAKPQTANKR